MTIKYNSEVRGMKSINVISLFVIHPVVNKRSLKDNEKRAHLKIFLPD